MLRTGTVRAPSDSHLRQFSLQRSLKLLHVGGGRTIPGLLWRETKATRLIEMPVRRLTITERYLAAEQRAGFGDVIH